MSSTELDGRVKQLEGSLDKAERLLESASQVLRTVEKARTRIERGSRVPLVLVAASALVGAVVVFVVARRQEP